MLVTETINKKCLGVRFLIEINDFVPESIVSCSIARQVFEQCHSKGVYLNHWVAKEISEFIELVADSDLDSLEIYNEIYNIIEESESKLPWLGSK